MEWATEPTQVRQDDDQDFFQVGPFLSVDLLLGFRKKNTTSYHTYCLKKKSSTLLVTKNIILQSLKIQAAFVGRVFGKKPRLLAVLELYHPRFFFPTPKTKNPWGCLSLKMFGFRQHFKN